MPQRKSIFDPASYEEEDEQASDAPIIVEMPKTEAGPVNDQPVVTDEAFNQTPATRMVDEVKNLSILNNPLSKTLIAQPDVTLSIASGVVGSTLGAINATAGLVKNTVDLVAGEINNLGAWLAKDTFPHWYDEAHKDVLHHRVAIFNDLVDDHNIIADTIQYEPKTEYGERFVNNMNNSLEKMKFYIGDKLAGIPEISDAPGTERYEIDSLEELEALEQMRSGSVMGEARKLLGAAGYSLIDTAMLIAGGLAFKSTRPGVLKTGEPSPVSNQIGAKSLDVTALDALEGSKPKFSSMQEATQRIADLASGKVRQQVVIETVQGLPTKVLSGQDLIMMAKETNKKVAAATAAGQPGGAVIRQLKVRTIERGAVEAVDKAAVAVANKAFEKDRIAAEQAAKALRLGFFNQLGALTLDIQGGVKNALLKSAGKYGERAVMELELAAGATPAASLATQDMWHRVFKNMSDKDGTGAIIDDVEIKTERQLFDQIARAQRIVAIEKTKQGKKIKPKFEAGTTGKASAEWLSRVRQVVGEERFAEYMIRTEALFEVPANYLKRYLDEGLITEKEYNSMKDIDYLQTVFVDKMDPIVQQKLGGTIVNVGESGIQPIGKGSTGGVVLDTETLISEFIIRAENRIARNRANQALYEVGKKDPKNQVVSIATKKDKEGNFVPRPGYETINVMIKGKKEGMYVPESLAAQWKIGDPAISATHANILRIGSGSAILRPLATGYNPAFIITNLPRDIIHAWLSTNELYSRHLPIYLPQIGRDMLTVARDSLTKTGRYRDYINEGGGLSFLTHQGRDIIAPSLGKTQIRHKPHQTRIKNALSYLNEQSEIITRLAIRERAIRNQKAQGIPVNTREATWQARRYLDFAQGGSATKLFDNFIPYTNATVQAYRSVAKAAKKNPVEFATKFMWLASASAGLTAYNLLFRREVMDQIPEDIKKNNMIIPTSQFIVDEDGNKRHVYFSVKKDQTIVPATAWLEQLVEYYVTGKAPTENVFKYLVTALPGTKGIPMMNAIYTVMADYNFWYQKDIFGHDENIENYAKYKGYPNPTSEIAKTFGEWSGFSPEGLQQGFRQLVPNNTYMQAAGFAYDMMLADTDPLEAASTTQEMLDKMPFVDRVYSLTHPAAVALDEMDRVSRPINTEQWLRDEELKQLLLKANRNGDYQDAFNYATSSANTDPFGVNEMVNKVEASMRMDTVFDNRKEELGYIYKGKTWWLGMLSQNSKARAQNYFENWMQADRKQRDFMDSTAALLSTGNLHFMDNEFVFTLNQLKNGRNTEVGDEE